ncbi:MAG: hypothetical protein ACRDY7_04305 [Acidimicrobiia bacterium]
MSRRMAAALLALVFAASGAYLLLYLVRWEWHRAIIAGVFFLGAEVALVGGVLFARLRAVERRLDAMVASPPADVVARMAESAPAPRAPFAWLKTNGEGLGVFLPVLLGAWLLASALAWLVESLARVTARPALERNLAWRLVPITFPRGGLLGEDPVPVIAARRRWGPLTRTGLVVALAAGCLFGYGALADALQTRPEREVEGVRTQLVLALYGNRGEPERVAAELWGACKVVLQRTLPDPTVTALDQRRVRLVVDADLGRHAGNRIRGCLSDATVDHLQAGVLSVSRLSGQATGGSRP